MQKTVEYIKAHYDEYLEELKEYLRIPSISTLKENKEDVIKCAEFTEQKMKQAGLTKTEIFETDGHPIVYGEWLGAPGKPTILIYGHYDVQPVDPLDEWETPPFEPDIRDNKIFARGATDDKGQLFIHMKSFEAFLKAGSTPPVNVKYIIEGEEEVGSTSLEPFIKEHQELLACDAILISDTSLYADGVPTITYGLRGLTYAEIEVKGPSQDLHSGSYGGAVTNPVNALAQIIAKMHDENGKITIPGIYDDVRPITEEEKENLKRLDHNEEELRQEVEAPALAGENNFTALERIWARPTFDVNGIIGGFTGDGAKTIIPSKASAKVSMRLVPDQDPDKVADMLEKHIKSLAPDSVEVTVHKGHGGKPFITPLHEKAMKAAAKAMSKSFGKETVFMREGGSIPIVNVFKDRLNAPVVLMGFGLNSENLHSPNEHFSLTHFKLGVLASAYFMEEFAE